ncbi:MAG: PSD1 and planctomycete cytochrome C domain-containing protein [Planctomycetota bacterium]|nr:PSD1 and planctomycete cytochrome C domain-containing protein [Planctomycetota bacterium]
MKTFVVSILLLLAAPAESQESVPVDFAKQVRPIFEKHCYKCHGSKEQKGGLRIDAHRFVEEGGDSGKPIYVAGKSAESRLFKFISGTDPENIMPPKGERLTPAEIALVKTWIDQGASWPEEADGDLAKDSRAAHWAFHLGAQPKPPATKQKNWARNTIDEFILARLEKKSVKPSPEADRFTLLRRLSLDLIGLPPSPEEVDAFADDESEDAYSKVVDRLLRSPHFGERWGRHWLDLARYADTDGYEKDNVRPNAWRWRDWVIKAFNEDLPFDQFTIQQLAGDLLPNATIEQRVATGFHRNTLTNREGGADQEEDRVKQTVDRANTTGTVWLGLTVGCAQCHSHKYDPISQREYYQFYSFFDSLNQTDIAAPTPVEQAIYDLAKKAYDSRLAEIEAEIGPLITEYEKEKLPTAQASWETQMAGKVVDWRVLEEATKASAESGAQIKYLKDGSYLLGGTVPDKDTYTLIVDTELSGITGFRIEALTDKSLPSNGPGRTGHGNFVLTHLTVTAQPMPDRIRKEREGMKNPAAGAVAAPEVEKDLDLADAELEANTSPAKQVKLQNATADFSQNNFQVAKALNPEDKEGWAISNQMGKPHTAVFETVEDTGFKNGARLSFKFAFNYGGQHTLGKFRISAINAPRPVRYGETKLPPNIASILQETEAKRTDAQKADLANYYKGIDAGLNHIRGPLLDHEKTAPKAPDTKAQTLAEAGYRQTQIHIRGDFLNKGAKVGRGTIRVLHKLPTKKEGMPNRLDLARWLVDAENPIAPRVAANRIWQHLLGAGLVETTDDFGLRGENPTHPQLLDWLAHEYRNLKWSRKEMIRLIVHSATYRQQSQTRDDLIEKDPGNKLLARQNRYRLEAETVRDISLASGGLLTPAIGGPSIRPPMPGDIAQLGYAGSVKWAESQGEERFRRGLYIFFQRTVPYPMLMAFDSPDSNVSCTRRERSNTPIQALTLLNDIAFFECAQGLARRIVEHGPREKIARIRYAFKASLSREPTKGELDDFTSWFETAETEYSKDTAAAASLSGKSKLPVDEQVQLAALTAASRILLNLDQFITRE